MSSSSIQLDVPFPTYSATDYSSSTKMLLIALAVGAAVAATLGILGIYGKLNPTALSQMTFKVMGVSGASVLVVMLFLRVLHTWLNKLSNEQTKALSPHVIHYTVEDPMERVIQTFPSDEELLKLISEYAERAGIEFAPPTPESKMRLRRPMEGTIPAGPLFTPLMTTPIESLHRDHSPPSTPHIQQPNSSIEPYHPHKSPDAPNKNTSPDRSVKFKTPEGHSTTTSRINRKATPGYSIRNEILKFMQLNAAPTTPSPRSQPSSGFRTPDPKTRPAWRPVGGSTTPRRKPPTDSKKAPPSSPLF